MWGIRVRKEMTSREAFEAWFDENFCGFDHELSFEVWQAAWEARGKHDAEVCREMTLYTGLDCAQAIEEQA